MRYLRMLSNAVAGGSLMAAYLAVLVLQLNPQLPVASSAAVSWVGALLAFYVPNLTVGFYLLILARDLVASEPLRPAWLSVRLLGWLGALEAALAAGLTWINLRAFGVVMSADAVARMRAGAWLTSATATVLLATAILRYSFGRRGSPAAAAVLVGTLALSVAAPLALRGPGDPPAARPQRSAPAVPLSGVPRVRLIALDGGSLGFIRQRVASGQLPNFGRLLDRGATMDLATVRPTEAQAVWAAAATGKFAQKNGVRSSRIYRAHDSDRDAVDVLPNDCFAFTLVEQEFVRASDLTASSLRARPMWDILSDYGVTAGLSGWPLTYPASAERGYILSDRFKNVPSSPLRVAPAGYAAPTTAIDVGKDTFEVWRAKPWQDVLASSSSDPPRGLDYARWDHAYADAAAELSLSFAPKLLAVRYEGLAALGHVYLRAALPEQFGDLRTVDLRRSVLDRYYAYIDSEIGEAMRQLAPGDLLLVVSGFGLEPVPLARRLLARVIGNPELSGTHESAPDGFLMAYGSNVVSSGDLQPGSIVDLAPTVLYYMGVPVGRDMDGTARRELFVSAYAMEHPVKYVASHER